MGGDVGIEHPVELTISHPKLSPYGIFQRTKSFDEYDLRKLNRGSGEQVKDHFAVDPLENGPTRTKVLVTPAKSLTYDELSDCVRAMIAEATEGMFDSRIEIERIVWDVRDQGVASDMREAQVRIR